MQFYTKNEQGRYDLINNKFTQLVTDIAVILGWDLKPVSNGVIDLTNNQGQTIRFSIKTQSTYGQASNPKISVSCLISELRPISDAYITDINYSANRGADAIAKDIQRRILPGYFELLALGKEHKQKEDDHKNKLRSKTQQLADILRTHPHPNYSEGDTISPTLKIKPEVGQSLGINLDVKDYINLKSEVSLACDDDDIDDVKIGITLPYDDKEALIRAYKGIGYNVNPSQLKDDLKYLTKQFKELSDWIKLVLERGLYNDFQHSFHKDVERRDLIGEIINKLEAESTQPQAESEPVAESTQPQAESEPEPTTREDDITELFGDDPELCEILCRLSLHTPWQYREVLKDELLRIRDRRALRSKLEAVQKIKDNPQTDRLLILEQLEQLHSSTQINVLVRALKKKFSSFKEAKLATGTKAISWEKLAEKLAA